MTIPQGFRGKRPLIQSLKPHPVGYDEYMSNVFIISRPLCDWDKAILVLIGGGALVSKPHLGTEGDEVPFILIPQVRGKLRAASSFSALFVAS